MAESHFGTVIRFSSDGFIEDVAGRRWRLSPTNRIIIDHSVDQSVFRATVLAYAFRLVWYQDTDLLWHTTTSLHHSTWSEGAAESPLSAQSDVTALVHTVLAKEDSIMATLADIQAALAAETTEEGKLIALATQMNDELKLVSTQLAAALASNDPVAMQAVVDQLNANTAAVDAELASLAPAPAPEPAPAPTP